MAQFPNFMVLYFNCGICNSQERKKYFISCFSRTFVTAPDSHSTVFFNIFTFLNSLLTRNFFYSHRLSNLRYLLTATRLQRLTHSRATAHCAISFPCARSTRGRGFLQCIIALGLSSVVMLTVSTDADIYANAVLYLHNRTQPVTDRFQQKKFVTVWGNGIKNFKQSQFRVSVHMVH